MNKCIKCKSDLTLPFSVSREYVNKDDKPSAIALGHYKDNFFESDKVPSHQLQNGRFDLLDDSDTCTNCEEKL